MGKRLCSGEGRDHPDFGDWSATAFYGLQQVTKGGIYLNNHRELSKTNQVRCLGIYLHTFSQIRIPSPCGSSRLKYLCQPHFTKPRSHRKRQQYGFSTQQSYIQAVEFSIQVSPSEWDSPWNLSTFTFLLEGILYPAVGFLVSPSDTVPFYRTEWSSLWPTTSKGPSGNSMEVMWKREEATFTAAAKIDKPTCGLKLAEAISKSKCGLRPLGFQCLISHVYGVASPTELLFSKCCFKDKYGKGCQTIGYQN